MRDRFTKTKMTSGPSGASTPPSPDDLGAYGDAPSVGRRRPAHLPLFQTRHVFSVIYLTVCTQGRKPILAFPDVHELLKSIWSSQQRTWRIGWYVLMPDHLHFFCAPSRTDAPELAGWMRWWRTQVTLGWPRQNEKPIWQRDFWDTQLRSHESCDEKWEYVKQNPVRAGLCRTPEDWPFLGKIDDL
jgi:REP element-mobilizing transposase RayT